MELVHDGTEIFVIGFEDLVHNGAAIVVEDFLEVDSLVDLLLDGLEDLIVAEIDQEVKDRVVDAVAGEGDFVGVCVLEQFEKLDLFAAMAEQVDEERIESELLAVLSVLPLDFGLAVDLEYVVANPGNNFDVEYADGFLLVLDVNFPILEYFY